MYAIHKAYDIRQFFFLKLRTYGFASVSVYMATRVAHTSLG